MKESTQMNSPPMRVIAQRGMLEKKLELSMAVTISYGSMVWADAPTPAARRMELMTPWTMLRSASMSSMP